VEWIAPVSLGVVGGPLPSSVPAGEGRAPVWTLGLLALAGLLSSRLAVTSGAANVQPSSHAAQSDRRH